MKILVFGGRGQFSSSIHKASKGEISVTLLPSEVADVSQVTGLDKILMSESPDFLMNVAAVHAKPDLEHQPGRAYAVNTIGSRNIADLSKRAQIPYTYVSTDFVFSGLDNTGKIQESAVPDAKLDVYAETKILGEQYALEKGHQTVVWRISSPFGPYDSRAKGKNFLNNVLERLSKGEVVDVVDNIFMSPTYTLDSANFLLELVQKDNSSGVWHGSNSGRTSWYQFAKYASQIAGLQSPNPVFSETPRDTSLDVSKLESVMGREVRSWQEAVRSYLRGD